VSGLTDTAATLQKEAELPTRPSSPPPAPLHPTPAQRPLSLNTPKQVLGMNCI